MELFILLVIFILVIGLIYGDKIEETMQEYKELTKFGDNDDGY